MERADEIDEIDETAQTALTVPYGRSALEALERAVAGAKHDDPLAPVTVVVPSALAAVTLRRTLVRRRGSGRGRHGRAAGARGAPRGPSGRRRWSRTPRAAASGRARRATLTDASSRFGSVAQHPATVDAVVRTFTELRTLDPPDLERLAASGRRAREVVELFRSYRRRAEHWLDDRDVVEMAIEAVTSRDPAVDEVGHVMLHLPRRLEAIDASLLAALHRIGRLSVIVGTTGDERADEPSRRVVAQLASAGVVVASATSASTALLGSVPRPEHIVRAADPAEEVRAATRLVLEHLDARRPCRPHRRGVARPVALRGAGARRPGRSGRSPHRPRAVAARPEHRRSCPRGHARVAFQRLPARRSDAPPARRPVPRSGRRTGAPGPMGSSGP